MTLVETPAESWLQIDPAETAQKIELSVEKIVHSKLRRKGVVVGLSGGIDSSVVAGLCAHSLGKDHVLGLIMPERECSGESSRLGQLVAASLGIQTLTENITRVLEEAGCYRCRDEAIRRLVSTYDAGYRCKLVAANITTGARYYFPSLVVESPDGKEYKVHLDGQTYAEMVAASNFKQRVRAMFEYYHADRLQYAVAGTPNRLEYDQGFFVKNGDGAADLKPIAHLYKSQVRQLAAYLQLPAEILERPSTTDTFPLAQSQEEFYFSVSLHTFDLCLYGLNHRYSPTEVAALVDLTPEQVKAVFESIESKRRATAYLHQSPLLIEEVPEVNF